MVQPGGTKASTREVHIPVLPLAVHALSTTLLCLSGTDVMIGASPSSFLRRTFSAAHPAPSSLISHRWLIDVQLRMRQPPLPMMALSQTVQHPRTMLQVQKIPSTSQASLHHLNIFKCLVGTIYTTGTVEDTHTDRWQGQSRAPQPSCRAPIMIPHRASYLVIQTQSQIILPTTPLTDTYLVQTQQQHWTLKLKMVTQLKCTNPPCAMLHHSATTVRYRTLSSLNLSLYSLVSM
ncbi:hypothetical protein KCU98_g13546, partial [Aureobasidium melanogenum]